MNLEGKSSRSLSNFSEVSSLYVHYPRCIHLCNFCDFFKYKDDSQMQGFESRLFQSFKDEVSYFEKSGESLKSFSTLFLGGGTPSLWGEASLGFFEKIFKYAPLVDDYEWTIEIDPSGFNLENINRFVDLGVNRFSIGVQCLNEDVFARLDRGHQFQAIRQVLDQLNELKQRTSRSISMSVDFMLGLPFSEVLGRDIQSELAELSRWDIDHVSTYIFTVPASFPNYKNLPSESSVAEEYLQVTDFLNQWHHYEVSNYARDQKSKSVHNLNYWNRRSCIAIGPSAAGFCASTNTRRKELVNGEKTSESLELEQIYLEEVYLTLRQANPFRALDLPSFYQKQFQNRIGDWVQTGLINREIDKEGDLFSLTSRGFLVLDSLVNDLL